MSLLDGDRIQEWFLIIGDSWQGANKRWIYGLLAVLVLALPLYFVIKIVFFNVFAGSYNPPSLIGQVEKAPLQEVEKKIITNIDGTYSGYVKLKNTNLDWGVPQLLYRAEFVNSSGTVLASISNESFVLPASEKYIVLPRYSLAQAPTQINFSVLGSDFKTKPDLPQVNLEIQRNQIIIQNNTTASTAVLKNLSPFTITQVDLPVVLYNDRSEIVAINYTNINDLKSGELRSFQVVWPGSIPGRLVAEIHPEINIFVKDILRPQGPVSPFE